MPVSSWVIIFLILIILGLLVIIYRLWRQTKRVVLGLDEVTEDTLKVLYSLSIEKVKVTSREIIRSADLQPGRYSLIQSELVRRGWVELVEERLMITPAGVKKAIQLIRAHRLWERYLVEKEALPLNAIHEEAMRREHTTTIEEVARIEEELGFPKFDPHGDPIPQAGEEAGVITPGMPLSQWPEKKLARIVHVEDEPPALFSQLTLMGLTPGAQVEIDERTPGRVMIWSGRQRLALANELAAMIFLDEPLVETIPLSELEIGQAARICAFDQTGMPEDESLLEQIKSGVEIIAWEADPMGDPITYHLDGKSISLSRIQANRIMVDAMTIREVAIPRPPWLAGELKHFQAIFRRYGSWAVIKRGFLFLGPAFIISVGYMDPGNWGTDIEGGARFGYSLLWVILMANMMAILLQILSAKLGIATGKTLPQVCRDHYPHWLSVALWVTAELAAMATDLAEFLGGAMGFYLLFHIPLFPAALITGAAISLILLLERYGYRKVELAVIGLIAVIGFVYMTEIWLSKPVWGEIIHGLVTPSIPVGATLVAVGIIGATVMPHNLYLHSSVIQTRVRPLDSLEKKRSVFRFAIVDSVVALNGAFFVNAAILIMSAAIFSKGRIANYSLEAAHQTLTPVLGSFAGIAFAVALLASGLSSSTTATMAGQVIMEGFLHHRMNVWLRRAITMIPSLIVIGLGLDPLQILVLSQVSLSFQLPFAVVPLVIFTGSKKVMGDFVNTTFTKILAWSATTIILMLNGMLLYQLFFGK
jgi:manganese transport protein